MPNDANALHYSFAEWPADTYTAPDGSHVSTDKHDSAHAALAVCGRLEREGYGGNGLVFPLRTWIEPVSEYEQHRDAVRERIKSRASMGRDIGPLRG